MYTTCTGNFIITARHKGTNRHGKRRIKLKRHEMVAYLRREHEAKLAESNSDWNTRVGVVLMRQRVIRVLASV